MLRTAFIVAMLVPVANAFSMDMSASGDSRRAFLNKVAATSAAVVSGGLSGGFVAPSPALAVGGGKKVGALLASYGLPDAIVPQGLTPLASIYGKGKNRFPLMVTFSHPVDWVVTLPSNDVNGEDGTIQAGEYAKGDTATLFVYSDLGNVKNIDQQDKDFYANAIIKAISQKGNNVYQNFKVTNVAVGSGEYRDQKYVICDFKYELLTGAGFEVDRRGVASITSQGDAVEVLWCATIRQRYKKLEPTLRDIAGSFRCYADGLKLSSDLA